MLEKADCYRTGTVRKTTGFTGELLVSLESPLPFPAEKLQFLLIELEDGIIPFHIRELEQISGNLLKILFTDVRSVDDAKKLNACPVYLEKKTLESGDCSAGEPDVVVGYQVIDVHHGLIGVITEVLRWPGQDLFRVEKGSREILLPVAEEYIISFSEKKRVLQVSLPDGLVDLNG